jgi:hypothetical protein
MPPWLFAIGYLIAVLGTLFVASCVFGTVIDEHKPRKIPKATYTDKSWQL